ncbi:uncharacterized protein BCN122_III0668 [Burkholderia cenocepacia]|nr:uncharacterized protein BCN122_III0668 [Burkholderia cenocepacia]
MTDIAKCGHGGLAPVGEGGSKGEARCGAAPARSDRARTTRTTRTAAARVRHRCVRAARAGVAHGRGPGGKRRCCEEPTASLRLRSK